MRKRKYRQAAACFLTAALILSAVPAPAVLAETETSSETIQQEIPEEESTVSVTSGTEVSEEESIVTVTPGTEVPEEESTITEMSGTEFPVETEPQTVPLTEQNTETETQVETKAEIQTESEIETETAIRMETSGETTEKETEVFIEQKAPRVENDVAIVKIGETETRCTTLVQAFAVANGNTATVTLLQNTTITDSINGSVKSFVALVKNGSFLVRIIDMTILIEKEFIYGSSKRPNPTDYYRKQHYQCG